MDWEDLRNFLAVARHGTLSGAARALGVQQSTVGRRLAGFEAQSGVMLLQKTPRGYVLTAAGEAARGEAERMEVAALAAERAITGRDARLEGEIRLTTVETLGAEILVPILARFAENYPGIFVKLIVGTRTLSLASREADLALRLMRPSGGDLLIRKLGELAFGFYASAEYVERHANAGADGKKQRVILMEDDVATFPEVMALSQRFPLAEVALRSNSRYAQLAACRNGMGIACLAHYLAAPHGLMLLERCEVSRELWLAQHRDTQHTPRFKALSGALATGLKLRAPLLTGV